MIELLNLMAYLYCDIKTDSAAAVPIPTNQSFILYLFTAVLQPQISRMKGGKFLSINRQY